MELVPQPVWIWDPHAAVLYSVPGSAIVARFTDRSLDRQSSPCLGGSYFLAMEVSLPKRRTPSPPSRGKSLSWLHFLCHDPLRTPVIVPDKCSSLEAWHLKSPSLRLSDHIVAAPLFYAERQVLILDAATVALYMCPSLTPRWPQMN